MANSKNKSNGNKVARVIAWVLILLLLLGAIAAILHFTNGGNESFKTFYLIHDGKDIVTAHSYAYYENGEQRFDVKYTFDIGKSEPRDYNVKIIPNADADFDFTVGEKQLAWANVGGLDDVFRLTKEPSYFTFTVPEEKSVAGVLGHVFPGESVSAPSEQELGPYLYSLIVSSYNEEVSYRIDFSLREIVAVERLEIEGGDIIF